MMINESQATAPPLARGSRSALGAAWHRLSHGGGLQAQGLIVFYVAVLVFFSLDSSDFLTLSNLWVVLADVAVIGVVSVGQTLAIISGGFDLSVAGVVPLGGVCYVELTNAGMPFLAATATVIVIGAVVGAVNGAVIAWLRISPLITTLATFSITSGVALTLTNGQTLVMHDLGAGWWGNSVIGGIQGGVIALVVLALIVAGALAFTVWGRSVYSVGGNREASRLAGIAVGSITLSVYAAAAACAALAGVITAGQLLAAAPGVAPDDALTSIAAVVLGGAALTGGSGRISGTLLGILLLGTIADGMAIIQVPTFYQTIATGAILLAAVLFGRLREVISVRQKES
jgi:ribose transport system permease protein